MTTAARVWRVAVIGISGYGRIHLQLARECRDRGEVTIVAVTVINPAEEAENIAELILFLAARGGKFMTGQLVTTRMRFG